MDEIEFRKRVYANPAEPDQEVLEAAAENPDYQKILDQTQAIDAEVSSLANGIELPAGLKDQLLSIPDTAAEDMSPGNETSAQPVTASFFRYYAMAAGLLLAVGVTFTLTFDSGPSRQELAFGNEVLKHLYLENSEIAAINSGNDQTIIPLQAINQVMANAGTQLASYSFQQNNPVRYANPCVILPQYQSAHLIVQGETGAVSFIVIKNSPVESEFYVQDGRFNGLVVPMPEGNMILVGEGEENLDQYRDLFQANVDWVI